MALHLGCPRGFPLAKRKCGGLISRIIRKVFLLININSWQSIFRSEPVISFPSIVLSDTRRIGKDTLEKTPNIDKQEPSE